jgi:hypothetical protein
MDYEQQMSLKIEADSSHAALVPDTRINDFMQGIENTSIA